MLTLKNDKKIDTCPSERAKATRFGLAYQGYASFQPLMAGRCQGLAILAEVAEQCQLANFDEALLSCAEYVTFHRQFNRRFGVVQIFNLRQHLFIGEIGLDIQILGALKSIEPGSHLPLHGRYLCNCVTQVA